MNRVLLILKKYKKWLHLNNAQQVGLEMPKQRIFYEILVLCSSIVEICFVKACPSSDYKGASHESVMLISLDKEDAVWNIDGTTQSYNMWKNGKLT